jgi:hypothetical protein
MELVLIYKMQGLVRIYFHSISETAFFEISLHRSSVCHTLKGGCPQHDKPAFVLNLNRMNSEFAFRYEISLKVNSEAIVFS